MKELNNQAYAVVDFMTILKAQNGDNEARRELERIRQEAKRKDFSEFYKKLEEIEKKYKTK